ncbi:MAG: PQQ-binding-like beta-propeller repeat protein [Bacteroidetes bacterium]|nr:PQQ-binding-like beta-propeller repeat protein [Bacteroidota bacterium]
MINNRPYTIMITGTILFGVILIVWWLFHDPVKSLTISVPGMDKHDSGKKIKVQDVKIGETFTFLGTAEEIPGRGWPRFRGGELDNISKETIPLTEKFGNIKERIRWKVELGEGHAGPAVFGGRVYLLDYDEKKRTDALRCFSLLSGKELWCREYKVHLKRNHGLSRTIPAVNSKYAVTIGPKCQVMCVDRISGDMKWGLDMAKQYDAEVPFWYTGQCPLLEGDTLILAPGGKALMIAIDCKTGKPFWETPNPKQWKMSHASVMKIAVSGKKMYVYFAIGGIFGVSASGGDTGKLLWETGEFSPAVVAPSPVALDDGRILLTAGYGAGSAMIQVKQQGGAWSVKMLQQFRPQEGIASEQQTPVFYKGTVYAILPKDAGGARNQFVSVSPVDGKKILATSGKNERFGLGPYLIADEKFFILNDDGEMTIARASASSFTTLDKAKILDGQDAWGPLAISGGYLLARDSKQMVCIDIRKK